MVLANGAGAPKKPGPNAGALAWIAYTIDVAFFGVEPLMVMPVGKASKVVGALGKVDEAVDLTKGGTYVLKNTEDAGMRTGRSKDLARRAGEHRRAEATRDLEFQVDRRTDVYAEQRGREHVIHDAHNPPLDKVNPISPKNPRRQEYLDAAKGVEQK